MSFQRETFTSPSGDDLVQILARDSSLGVSFSSNPSRFVPNKGSSCDSVPQHGSPHSSSDRARKVGYISYCLSDSFQVNTLAALSPRTTCLPNFDVRSAASLQSTPSVCRAVRQRYARVVGLETHEYIVVASANSLQASQHCHPRVLSANIRPSPATTAPSTNLSEPPLEFS